MRKIHPFLIVPATEQPYVPILFICLLWSVSLFSDYSYTESWWNFSILIANPYWYNNQMTSKNEAKIE